jgi:outer membrane usher protein
VALNIGTLDKETEIDTTTSRVIPTRGALARADFKARTGQRALITLMRNGKPLPFGTSVSAEGAASIVGDEGQVYLSGLAPKGQITAQWGSGSDQQCKANYQLPEKSADVALVRIDVQCF